MANDKLLLRQQQLRVRSAELRITLTHQTQVLHTPLAIADQVRRASLWLYHHPQWPLGALVALAVARPRRIVVWAPRLWGLWKSAQRLRGWIDTLNRTSAR